jgi:hypothetical protein
MTNGAWTSRPSEDAGLRIEDLLLAGWNAVGFGIGWLTILGA